MFSWGRSIRVPDSGAHSAASASRPHGCLRFALVALCAALFPAANASDAVRIRVAGAQIPVVNEVARNVEALTRAIEHAARAQADVLVTPEGSLSGYTPDFDAAATEKALETIVQRAREAKLALVLGTCFQMQDGRRYNAQRYYDKDGQYLGFHAKILLCRKMSDPTAKAEVDSFQTRPLRTFKLAGLTVGGLVCNDMWANPEWTPMADPYLAHQLSVMGADLIFVSAYTGRSTGEAFALSRAYHDANLRIRARLAKRWVVVVNAAESAGDKQLHAPSGVLAPDGRWIAKVEPNAERIFVHTIETTPGALLAAQ